MARVFLSYAREDAERARQLAETIGRGGHDVWWDRHIQGGARFASEIARALKDAEAVVVLWSEASVHSAWVQDEAAEGRDSDRLVPVILDEVRPPLGFRQYHCIEFDGWDGTGDAPALHELLASIDRLAATPAEPAEAPETVGRVPDDRPSVCVLPFVNMSGDAEQEYFSDGISEDIITDLSKVSALSVVARNTAFQFKGQAVDITEVASRLRVGHVLEGSVRKAGDRLRISAQLVDGASGRHLWAERYDRDLTDIFAIQDEISKAIVEALSLQLLPGERKAIGQRGTSNVEAYSLYLLARQHWIAGPLSEARDAAIVRFCRRAVELDPAYAEAWALAALAECELRFWHGRDVNAVPTAERALAINPQLPEPYCVKAVYADVEGREEEAEALIAEALRLDPESWEVNRETARLRFRQGRTDEAIPYFEKATSLMNTDFHNPFMLITCYIANGDRAGLRRAARTALERAEKVLEHDALNTFALVAGASALANLDRKERAREWIERALLVDPENHQNRYNLACSLAAELEDPEGALDVLEPFFERVNHFMLKHLEADPDWDTLRNHPRFIAMLAAAKQRLGMTTGTDPDESRNRNEPTTF